MADNLTAPVTIQLSKTGATDYEIRNFDGDVVSSGSVDSTTLVPTPPTDGWKAGWYRCYLSGPSSSPTYGNSYGRINFLVVPQNDNFPTLPASTRNPNGFGEFPSGWGDGDFNNATEQLTRACLGLGVGRLSIFNTASPSLGQPPSFDAILDNQMAAGVIQDWWQSNTNGGTVDPVRARPAWVAFSGTEAWDQIIVPSTGIPFYLGWMRILPKDPTVDGSKVFISIDNGTTAGTYKLTVSYPDSSTVVETYDNISSANLATSMASINSSSSYIKTFWAGGYPPTIPFTTRAIGNTYRNGVIEVVQGLYDYGIHYFEGPFNEWESQFGYDLLAHGLWLFAAAVHAGNANAKAMGPCAVNITDFTNIWTPFGRAVQSEGFADEIDAISTHAYNTLFPGGPGNINLARNVIEAWIDLLATYGLDDKPRWQTEAHNVILSRSGPSVYMPRRSRTSPLWWIIWEQYGTPAEQNPYWYDYNHGFYNYPAWLFMGIQGDMSPNPHVGLLSTLARETYGKAFHHRIDFGSEPANHLFVGNVYGSAATGSVAVVVCQSYLDTECSVTFTVSGTTSALTYVDAWGNEGTLTQSSGRVTLPCSDIPTYLRLPAGVNVTVYSVNDWGTNPHPSVSPAKLTVFIGTANQPGACDGRHMQQYTGGFPGGIGVYGSNVTTLPDSVTIMFFDGDTPTIERVIIWTGGVYQSMTGLVDFDIQTTTDGVNWTTQKTVTHEPQTSFRSGSDGHNAGTELETFSKEQWIEDVKLDTPVTCSGVRVYVRELTYGGMPDLASGAAADGTGQGTSTPSITIQEIGLISSDTFTVEDINTTLLADTPLFLYDYEETSGTTVGDSSGNGVNGTISGSVAWGQVSSVPGGALELGTGTHTGEKATLTATSNSLIVGDTFTFETLFKLNSTSGFQNGSFGIFGIGSSQGHFLAGLSIGGLGAGQTHGALNFFGSPNASTALTRLATATGTLDTNTWYHFAVSKNGSDLHLYVNGVDLTSIITNVTIGSSNQIWIGDITGSGLSMFDKTAFYGTALSPSTINAHYRSMAIPTSPTNTRVPNLEGTTVVGDQVNCVPGGWAPQPNAFAYQWQRSNHGANTWADITGATTPIYTLVAADSGKDIRCGVVASTVGGASSAVYSNTFTIS